MRGVDALEQQGDAMISEIKLNEIQTISGKVVQIIPPEKHEDFLKDVFCNNIKGRFVVVIEDKNIQKGSVSAYFTIKPKDIHTLVLDTCGFEVGDFVTLKTTPIYEKTEFLTLKGERNLFNFLGVE